MGYGIRIQEALQIQLVLPLPSNRPLVQSTHKNYTAFERVIKRVNTQMISDEKWILSFNLEGYPFLKKKKKSSSENYVSVCHFPFV